MAKKVAKVVAEKTEKVAKVKHEYDLTIIAEVNGVLAQAANRLDAAKAFEAAKRVLKVREWCTKVTGRDADAKAKKVARLKELLEKSGLTAADLS
jgi:hypothetical protein